MGSDIDISIVIPVYNKAGYLERTIDSIVNQQGSYSIEYIFVDDCSNDNSLQILKQKLKNIKNVVIINNDKNLGPTKSINRGLEIASGEYVWLMDADDILVKNAFSIMMPIVKEKKADVFFGNFKKTQLSSYKLIGSVVPSQLSYTEFDKPLQAVLNGRYVRMSYLIRLELLKKINYLDDRIFIQDESLPIRITRYAKNLIKSEDPFIFCPKVFNSLSKNVDQQHHDRFYAYYYACQEFEDVDDNLRYLLFLRAISSIWKSKRKRANFFEKIIFFLRYIKLKCSSNKINWKFLEGCKKYADRTIKGRHKN